MVAVLAFSAAMLACAGWDLAERRIPNALSVTILLAGIAHGAVAGEAFASLLGAAVGLGLMLPLFHVRWIGAGDVKMVVAIGGWVGATGVVWVTIGGLALGGLVSAAMLADAPLRREVLGNLKLAAYTLETPAAPRRGKRQLVPMAVAIAVAALGWVAVRGGLA